MNVSTAEGVVKALAAMGGVTAGDLDFRQTRDDICARLDEHVHDIWAKNKMEAGTRYGVERTKNAGGRDLTHPDLVPFKDLSAASKVYDHDINVIILDTIHKEGLTIAPQVKNDIVIDTSHVKMTDALKAAAEKAARTEHAIHLEMEPFEDSPVMKPWEELDPRDRQMMLDEAGKKLMLVAAIGGLSPEMFEDKESFNEICDTLDDFIMERNHRSDRELVHEENEIFLQAVEKSGIVVEAQQSRDVEEMERRMKDAFRKEPALEPELPGNYEHAAQLLANVRLTSQAAVPDGGKKYLPPKEYFDNDRTFAVGEAKLRGCTEGFRCPKDTLVEYLNGEFMCVIPKDTIIAFDQYGHLDMKGFGTVGRIDFNDFSTRKAGLRAVYDMVSESGVRVDPLARKDPEQLCTMKNLYDEALAEKVLSDARSDVKLLQKDGFLLTRDYRDRGDTLGGELGRLLSGKMKDSVMIDTLAQHNYGVKYTGSDEAVIKAIHDDRANAKSLARRSAYMASSYLSRSEWEMAKNEIGSLFMGNITDRRIEPTVLLQKAVDTFVGHLKDPLSNESVLMDSLPGHDNKAVHTGEAFRSASWMLLTGCSYNSAVQMAQGQSLPLELPYRAMQAINEYKAQKEAYDRKGLVGKVFSREPKAPEEAIQAMSDKIGFMEHDWRRYVTIESVFRATPESKALLQDTDVYMENINTKYARAMMKVAKPLAGVPGAEKVVEQARSLHDAAARGVIAGQKGQSHDGEVKGEDARMLREYGVPEDVIKTVISEGSAEFKGTTHNRPSTETSPADPRLDVKTSMRLERATDGSIIVKDPVGRDMKVGDFLKMGYRDLLATKKEAYAGLKHGARLPSDATEKIYKMPPYKQGKFAANAKKQHRQDQASDNKTKKGPKIK